MTEGSAASEWDAPPSGTEAGATAPPEVPAPLSGTEAGRAALRRLWDPPPPSTRGRTRGLGVESIVAAAIALAEEDGLEALTMRRLASDLGVGTMSLYTHIPGRDELLELMIDRTYAHRALPDPALPWREQLTVHADEAWRMYREHPWLVDTPLSRTPLGPGVLRVLEDLYRATTLIGLPPADTARVAGLVEDHVFAAAREVILDTRLVQRSGVSVDDYWGSRADFWTSYYRAEDHPTMTRLWAAGAFEREGADEDAYRYGLDLILDGLERG